MDPNASAFNPGAGTPPPELVGRRLTSLKFKGYLIGV
jgi:hypothetical protein